MLEIFSHLCEQGGDPTRANKQGKTAKQISENENNKIAVVFLGM